MGTKLALGKLGFPASSPDQEALIQTLQSLSPGGVFAGPSPYPLWSGPGPRLHLLPLCPRWPFCLLPLILGGLNLQRLEEDFRFWPEIEVGLRQ